MHAGGTERSASEAADDVTLHIKACLTGVVPCKQGFRLQMLITGPTVCLSPEYIYLLSSCHICTQQERFISFGAMKLCLQYSSHTCSSTCGCHIAGRLLLSSRSHPIGHSMAAAVVTRCICNALHTNMSMQCRVIYSSASLDQVHLRHKWLASMLVADSSSKV